MRYPNLLYALFLRRMAQYELAQALRINESRLSRLLSGRFDFSEHEKQLIAELLGCDPVWLFAQPVPPPFRRGDDGTPGLTVLATR